MTITGHISLGVGPGDQLKAGQDCTIAVARSGASEASIIVTCPDRKQSTVLRVSGMDAVRLIAQIAAVVSGE